jgi:7-keto-8-aminopelargonate synthetase-like enzyme
MMKSVLGALLAILVLSLSLPAQQHDHHAPPDSAVTAGHGCVMGGMHGGAMQGHGMMHSRDSATMKTMGGAMGMMDGDSAMTGLMRFAPSFVLTNRELLALTSSQVAEIELLMQSLPDSATHEAHRTRVQQAAAQVRGVLTADQRAQVERLPAPCPMMNGSPMGGAENRSHDEHRPRGH